jgi:antitoxin Phd
MPKPTKQSRKPRQSRSTWQIQTAKAQFSEVIRRARTEGPQMVTKQGHEEVVIVAAEEFKRMKQRSKQPADLVEFFAKSPLAEAHINLEREDDYGREIDL